MQNKYLKIKSFSLSEMIIVLLITIIVVGLAFSILQLVQKQMRGIGENYEINTEINLLRQALAIDFATYPYIMYNNITNTIRCENEMGYQDYVFEEQWVTRDRDTFKLKLINRTFYFDGLENTSGRIDALELETIKEQGNKVIFVHQENASNEYMY